MIIHLFHGTTVDALAGIKTYGFGRDDGETVWTCSDCECTYFYQLDKFVEYESLENDDLQEQINNCAQRANEQGQIANAVLKTPSNTTVVIHLSFDTDKIPNWEEYIFEDDSCENMASCGAVCVENDTLREWFEKGVIKGEVLYYDFITKLSLIYLINLVDNVYFGDSISKLSSIEESVLRSLTHSSCDFCLEELLYCECVDIQEFIIEAYQ